MKNLGLALAVLWFVFATSMPSANACGVDWQVPTNHFDSVNEMGEFSYWRQIGQVDFGNDLKVPLIIGFKPNRGGKFVSWAGVDCPDFGVKYCSGG